MVDHEKIKSITNDVYNRFYLAIKNLDLSYESWEKIISLSNEVAGKHNDDRLCKDLLLAYTDEFERASMNGGRK